MCASLQRRNAVGRVSCVGHTQPRVWVSAVSSRAMSRPVHRAGAMPARSRTSQIWPTCLPVFSAGMWAISWAAVRCNSIGRGVELCVFFGLPARVCACVGENLNTRDGRTNPPEGDRGPRPLGCGEVRGAVRARCAAVRSVAREGFLDFLKGAVMVVTAARGEVSAQTDAARNCLCPWCASAAVDSRVVR